MPGLTVDAPEGDTSYLNLRMASLAYQHARHTELAGPTREGYRGTLHSFVDTVGPQLVISRLAARHVEAWLHDLTVSPSTVVLYLSRVKAFTKWLAAQRMVRYDPCTGIHGPKRPRSLPRELDTLDVQKLLLAAPDARAELIIHLMVMEGLRCVEVATRNIEDIDFSEKLLFVVGKGGHERWVPLSGDTMEALRAYLSEYPAGSGPLVRSYMHPARGLTRQYISILAQGWMRDAGVKDFAWDGKSAHALRHTMAGTMLDEGATISDVQAALGHSSIATTGVYLKRRDAAGRLRDVMGQRSYRLGGSAPAETG